MSADQGAGMLLLFGMQEKPWISLPRPALARLIQPIVCKSPSDQERIAQIVAAWRGPGQVGNSGNRGKEPGKETKGGRRLVWMNLGLLLLALLLMIGTFLVAKYFEERSVVIAVELDQQGLRSPEPHAKITAGHCQVTADERGTYRCAFSPAQLPVKIVATSKGISGEIVGFRSFGGWQGILAPGDLGKETVVLTARAPDDPEIESTRWRMRISGGKTIPAPFEASPQALPPLPDPLQRNSKRIVAASIAALLLLAAWRLWLRRAPAAIRRRTEDSLARQLTLSMKLPTPTLALQDLMYRFGLAWRHSARIGSTRIDIGRTVNASARHAGMFTPVHGRGREAPIVGLVHSMGLADHSAELNRMLVAGIAGSGADMRAYLFSGSGTSLHVLHEGQQGSSRSVRVLRTNDVIADMGDATVFFFCEPPALFDTLSGGMLPWVRALFSHARCVLLILDQSYGNSEEAALIRQAGADIVHVGSTSVSELLIVAGRPTPLMAPAAAPVRRAYSDRLLSEDNLFAAPPEAGEIARLCTRLKVLLGAPGFHWLQACAVFPELRWSVTLAVGAHLIPDRGIREQNLLHLIQLVWFRKGYMPDWLRSALIARLDGHREQPIREFYWSLFTRAESDASIVIGQDGKETRRLSRWRTARLLATGGHSGQPVERLYIHFLLGIRPAGLDLGVPRWVRAHMRNLLRAPLFGLGAAGAACMAAAVLLLVPASTIEAVASTPTPKRVIVAGIDTLGRLVAATLDIDNNKLVYHVGLQAGAVPARTLSLDNTAMRLSPSSQLQLSATGRSVIVWDGKNAGQHPLSMSPENTRAATYFRKAKWVTFIPFSDSAVFFDWTAQLGKTRLSIATTDSLLTGKLASEESGEVARTVLDPFAGALEIQSPRGTSREILGRMRNFTKLWDEVGEISTPEGDSGLAAVAVARVTDDGALRFAECFKSGEVRVWRRANLGKPSLVPVARIAPTGEACSAVAFNPTGDFLLVGSASGATFVVNLSSKPLAHTVDFGYRDRSAVTNVAYSSNMKAITAVRADGTISWANIELTELTPTPEPGEGTSDGPADVVDTVREYPDRGTLEEDPAGAAADADAAMAAAAAADAASVAVGAAAAASFAASSERPDRNAQVRPIDDDAAAAAGKRPFSPALTPTPTPTPAAGVPNAQSNRPRPPSPPR